MAKKRKAAFSPLPEITMIGPLFLVYILIAPNAVGQTNFYELLPYGDITYTNALISETTPAYATVIYPGGVIQASWGNLPPSVQQQYHYSSNAAAEFLLEKQRVSVEMQAADAARRAAYEKSLAAANGPVRNLQILAVVDEDSNGGFPLCAIGVADRTGDAAVPGRLLVKNLPDEVKNFLRRRQQLKAEIAQLENQPVSVTARSTLYNPDGSVDQANSQWAAQNAADSAYARAVQDKHDRLDQLNRQLKELEDAQSAHTTIRAYPTGQTYGSYDIWMCSGMAPQNL